MFAPGDKRREGTVIVYADEDADAMAKTGSHFSVSDQQEGVDPSRGLLGNYKYHPRKESYTSGSDQVNSQNMMKTNPSSPTFVYIVDKGLLCFISPSIRRKIKLYNQMELRKIGFRYRFCIVYLGYLEIHSFGFFR